jgi:hypothetical protein
MKRMQIPICRFFAEVYLTHICCPAEQEKSNPKRVLNVNPNGIEAGRGQFEVLANVL